MLLLTATGVALLLTSFFEISFSAVFYILISGLIGLFGYAYAELKSKEEKK